MNRFFFCFCFLLTTLTEANAQNIVDSVVYTVDKAIPAYVYMQKPQVNNYAAQAKAKYSDASQVLRDVLGLNAETTVVLTDTMSDFTNGFHQFYAEYYKGVKVEDTRCTVHYKNGAMSGMTGNFRTVSSLNVVPGISQDNALTAAQKNVGAEKYAWEDAAEEALLKRLKGDDKASYAPKGELVVYVNGDKPLLAYAFNITALNPYSVQRVYVDAHNGEVVASENLIHYANPVKGTAETLYSGKREITTEKTPYGYILHDYSRGNGIITKDFVLSDYTDNDNNWTSAEWDNSNNEGAALEAHWGMEQVYDFFLKKFGRNSYDNKGAQIISKILMAKNDDAYWNSKDKIMNLGRTEDSGKPIVCLDIVAHEFSHAIFPTRGGENGAIGEGLGDIWGICVERYAKPEKGDNIWVQGDEIGEAKYMRDIRNPVCKYYNGEGWCKVIGLNDYANIHQNSGVMSHWFYTIVNGGTCENKKIYGIGFDKAEKICYLLQTTRLEDTHGFTDVRRNTIDIARDLYGENSEEVITVKNAWYYVGVKDGEDFITTTMTGPTLLNKGETATFKVTNVPSNARIDLGGVELVSRNSTNIVVKATGSARAYINITSTLGGGYIYASQSLWVGVPIISGVYYNSKDNYLEAETFGGDAQISSISWVVDGSGYSIYPSRYRPYRTQGTINVSVRATNACGTGPEYTCKVLLSGSRMLSIAQSDDSRTISVLSDMPNDGTNDHCSYRLTDTKTGNIASSGSMNIGSSISFDKEKSGIYMLELMTGNEKPSRFKIVLR